MGSAVRVAVCLAVLALPVAGRADGNVPALPSGVRAVWDLDKAWREITPTRERISINGLWKWQPAGEKADAVPVAGWGYFKVPGPWPGRNEYLLWDSQRAYPDGSWKDANLREVRAAWHQRDIAIPRGWAGRRILLRAEYVHSLAEIRVDGQPAGVIRFPGGDADLTAFVKPGVTHVLSLLVTAVPLKGVVMSYADTAHAKEVKGDVERRGLCGDVWLVSEPAGPRIAGVRVGTSVRRWSVTFDTAVTGLEAGGRYRLRARIKDGERVVKKIDGPEFGAADLRDGRVALTADWRPDKLWDLDTPANQYVAEVTLESGRRVADAWLPERFGFRELWIAGRDLVLNGARLHCSVLPEDNSMISAAQATYEASREAFARLQHHGYNAVYGHNYGCEPGTNLSYGEVLRAADDAGMLVFFAMPHFGQYEWDAADASATNGYAGHAAFFARQAGNHPSVVMYAMSHNGAGYAEDMNPDMLGGAATEPERGRWAQGNAKKCLQAEAIVRALDPDRIVYHHSGGNLGAMHTVNFYANWSPPQEQAEWLEPWATRGTVPLFFCEYGVPLSWDWTMYRGWYRGNREWGGAVVPWEQCQAEWTAQFLGDAAFRPDEQIARNLRWEAEQFRSGAGWYRWDYPVQIGRERLAEQQAVFAEYLTAELRGFRGWGLSAWCLWDADYFWERDGVDRSRRELATDWDRIQRPGFSPDFVDGRENRWDLDFARTDWTPTAAGKAVLRDNAPLTAWIAGRPGAFTERGHVFAPGETVAKQLLVVNDSRRTVTCACAWLLDLPAPVGGSSSVTIKAGEQARVPVSVPLPAGLAPGAYTLSASFAFGTGLKLDDAFAVRVVGAPEPVTAPGRVALFDPQGGTAALLDALHVGYTRVDAGTGLAGNDLLVVGRQALSATGPAPDVSSVRDGLKVLVFEQDRAVLERRFGFRAVEYGLRQAFRRVPGSPALDGLDEALLRDWRGAATLMPGRLDYRMVPMHGPTVEWCGLDVARTWRVGCRGNVASVLIEKPARGDFLPLVDGGYSLQFAPLLEYREGKGMVLFCQMDVTGRTESDPAAARLVRNLVAYAAAWKPAPRRTVAYAGEPAGARWLKDAGYAARPYRGGELRGDEVLVVGPKARATPPRGWLDAGGRMVAVGLDGSEINAVEPAGVRVNPAEHIAAVFAPPGPDSPLAGVGPADVYNRDPRKLSLAVGGLQPIGDGVLAAGRDGRVVFDALAPWAFSSTAGFTELREDPADDPAKHPESFVAGGLGLRRTFRRSSFALARLLANQGAAGTTPLLTRFGIPPGPTDQRFLDGLYLDRPVEWDDPYRFFRW